MLLPSPMKLPTVLLEAGRADSCVQTLGLHFRAALNNVSSSRCRKSAELWCHSSAFATIIPLGWAEVSGRHSGKCTHRHKQSRRQEKSELDCWMKYRSFRKELCIFDAQCDGVGQIHPVQQSCYHWPPSRLLSE